MFKGEYPADVLEGLGPHMPKGWQDDMATIRQPLDWLGLNYYTCKRIAAEPAAAWPHLSEHVGALPKTQMGWEICPEGLAHFLHFVGDYAGNLPLYVTENGMANPDSPEQPDDARIAYLNDHLDAAKTAWPRARTLRAISSGRFWTITSGPWVMKNASGWCMSISKACNAAQKRLIRHCNRR